MASITVTLNTISGPIAHIFTYAVAERVVLQQVDWRSAPDEAVKKVQKFDEGVDFSDHKYYNTFVPRAITFPYGPIKISYANMALQYQSVARPGLKPLLEASAQKNRTLSFSALIIDKATRGMVPVEETLAVLEEMAVEDLDCQFFHGSTGPSYFVRITKLSYESVRRDLTGAITQARVTLQLTEKPQVNTEVVQLRAITQEPDIVPSTGGEDEPEPELPRWHTEMLAMKLDPNSEADRLIYFRFKDPEVNVFIENLNKGLL